MIKGICPYRADYRCYRNIEDCLSCSVKKDWNESIRDKFDRIESDKYQIGKEKIVYASPGISPFMFKDYSIERRT